MVYYYENYKGYPNSINKNISINDSLVAKLLNSNNRYKIGDRIISIDIEEFPNEKGFFMLWEISLNEDKNSKRIIPIFINEDLVLRPLAGKKIWDELIRDNSKINVSYKDNITYEFFEKIMNICINFAYDTFLEMLQNFEKRNDENYNKYIYALDLRIEAATRIGIINIRNNKLANFERKTCVEMQYKLESLYVPNLIHYYYFTSSDKFEKSFRVFN